MKRSLHLFVLLISVIFILPGVQAKPAPAQKTTDTAKGISPTPKAPAAAPAIRTEVDSTDYCGELESAVRSRYTVLHEARAPIASCANVNMDFPALVGSMCRHYSTAQTDRDLDPWFKDLQDFHALTLCLPPLQFTQADTALGWGMEYLFKDLPKTKAVKAAQGMANAQILFLDVSPASSGQRYVWARHSAKLDAWSKGYLPDGIWVWNFMKDTLEFYSFQSRKIHNQGRTNADKLRLDLNKPSSEKAILAKNQAPVSLSKTAPSSGKSTVIALPDKAKGNFSLRTEQAPENKSPVSIALLPESLEDLARTLIGDTTDGQGCPSLIASMMVLGACCGNVDCKLAENKDGHCCSIMAGGGMGGNIPPFNSLVASFGNADLACVPDLQFKRDGYDPQFGYDILLSRGEQVCKGVALNAAGPSSNAAFGTDPFIIRGTQGQCDSGDKTGMSDKPAPPPKSQGDNKGGSPSAAPAGAGSKAPSAGGASAGSESKGKSCAEDNSCIKDPPRSNESIEPRDSQGVSTVPLGPLTVPSMGGSSNSGKGGGNSSPSSGGSGGGSGGSQSGGSVPQTGGGQGASGGSTGSSGSSSGGSGRSPREAGEPRGAGNSGSSGSASGSSNNADSSKTLSNVKCPPVSTLAKTSVGEQDLPLAITLAQDLMRNDPAIQSALQDALAGCDYCSNTATGADVNTFIDQALGWPVIWDSKNCHSDKIAEANPYTRTITIYEFHCGESQSSAPSRHNFAELIESVLHEYLHAAQAAMGVNSTRSPFDDAPPFADRDYKEHDLIKNAIDHCNVRDAAKGAGGTSSMSFEGGGEGDECSELSMAEASKRRKLACPDSMKEAQKMLQEVHERTKEFWSSGGSSPAAGSSAISQRGAPSGSTPTPDGDAGGHYSACSSVSYANRDPTGGLGGCDEGREDESGCNSGARAIRDDCGTVNCAPGQMPDPSQSCRCVGSKDLNNKAALPASRPTTTQGVTLDKNMAPTTKQNTNMNPIRSNVPDKAIPSGVQKR